MINSKPIIGITMGDPAGIGPEIAARALATDRVYPWPEVIWNRLLKGMSCAK